MTHLASSDSNVDKSNMSDDLNSTQAEGRIGTSDEATTPPLSSDGQKMSQADAKAEASRRWGWRGAVFVDPAVGRSETVAMLVYVGRGEDRAMTCPGGSVVWTERFVPLGSGKTWEEAFESADKIEEIIR